MEFRLGGIRVTPADFGSDAEQNSADRIEQLLDQMGINGDVYVGGGSGHGHDISVDIDGQEIIFEVKSSGGSWVDYKQFRIRIDDEEGTIQSTKTEDEACVEIFDSIKDELDQELEVWNSNFPEGPSLTEAEAEEFWYEYEGDDWVDNHSPSAPVHRCDISAEELQTVLANAGNDYIIIGQQVFALFSGYPIEELCDYVDEAYALLRIKYHKTDNFSYTMTLRARISDSGQDFDDQIFRIFDSL